MKILKNFTLFAFALMMVAGSLTSCKKGEQDPGISLKSRAARMDGNYTVNSATITGDSTIIADMPTFGTNCKWTTVINRSGAFNGEREITKINGKINRLGCGTNGSGDTTSTFTDADTSYYRVNISFTKDGSYTWTHTIYDPKQTTAKIELEETGTWNFTGKIGDVKNKEQIVLIPVTTKIAQTDANGTITSSQITDQTENSRIYSIIGLRSDEIILSQYQQFASANNQVTGSTTTEYTLTEGGAE